jgi:YVTN family beta-propeller protein
MSRQLLWSLLLGFQLGVCAVESDSAPVGVQKDGRVILPTNQVLSPAGKQLAFPGRPVDVAVSDDGKHVLVKSAKEILVVSAAKAEVVQKLPVEGGCSVTGMIMTGATLDVTDAKGAIRIAQRTGDAYAWTPGIDLPAPAAGGRADASGMALLPGERMLVATTRGNRVHEVDLAKRCVVASIDVGVAPYAVVLAAPDRAYVSNWGGDRPQAGQPQGPTSGSRVHIDEKTGTADTGTVSVLRYDGGTWKAVSSIPVGLHPSGMILDRARARLYVANADSDTVSVIDTSTDAVIETIACRPRDRLPFGSGSNALALSPDERLLYVANGTNNCLAVVALGTAARGGTATGAPVPSAVSGLVPTGWYPGAIALLPDGRLVVANVKGSGALSQPRPAAQGHNSRDALGSLSFIEPPSGEQLKAMTAVVEGNDRMASSISGLEPPRADAAPAVVPQRHGEPSRIRHVVYVIKENRTYDQVLGDMKEGNGDAKLVMFGEEVTPNQHALARQFTLFDNFYCSGVLSADGHSWVNAAYVTDYLEKAFGAFPRSYPYSGEDALAFPHTGFLWSNALAHGKTFRNFGEFTFSTFTPKDAAWSLLYADWKNGTAAVQIAAKANIAAMVAHTHPGYPGFCMNTPDVYRARLFTEELKRWEADRVMPDLVYLFLPCDHTQGITPGLPTPRAMVADNDLALGQVVDAVTHSSFWPQTCVFVVEDDPQAGNDHVDGHRTVAMAISPYTRRAFVDHTNYTQCGMVKTIELMLSLPPMNQMDLAAVPMRGCFEERADLAPYACVPNRIPLDEVSPAVNKMQGSMRRWSDATSRLDFSDADRADEGTLNRVLWFSTHGDEPYPMMAGAVEDDDD